ncbi:hypothetical protein, partial [Azospirillum sp.]|uniref:hypothetical protein n=1 Tax=Azospirillum sp. TaxID=34012 RepID=UPI002D6319FF
GARVFHVPHGTSPILGSQDSSFGLHRCSLRRLYGDGQPANYPECERAGRSDDEIAAPIP